MQVLQDLLAVLIFLNVCIFGSWTFYAIMGSLSEHKEHAEECFKYASTFKDIFSAITIIIMTLTFFLGYNNEAKEIFIGAGIVAVGFQIVYWMRASWR